MDVSQIVNLCTIEGYLSCFQFLMMMIKAAINLSAQGFCECKFLFYLCKYPGIGFLDHMVNLCLILWETANLLSKVAVTFCIFSSNKWEFPLFYILVSTWYWQVSFLFLFCLAILTGVNLIIVLMQFPKWPTLSIFLCVYFPFMYLLWWSVFQIFCLF